MASPSDGLDRKVLAYVHEVLRRSKPYLIDVEQRVAAVENGIIVLELKVYQGRVTDVLTHETRRIKY